MSDYSAGILVVDDEHFFREAIAEILAAEGLECSSVGNGAQALECATDTRIGVVVLDIRLPGLDGIQVLARLLELRPSLRVIMLSASTDQELVLEALRLGACDYLAKPLHDEELVLAVRRALETFSVASDWTRLRGRLERLVARMEELAAWARAHALTERLQVLQQGVVEAASDVLEAEKTSLMLLDPDREVLRVVAAVGRDPQAEPLRELAAGEGVAGVVLQRSEPLLVEDIERDPLFAGFGHADRYASRSFALAPLIAGGRAIGVLCATDRAAGGRFGEDDLQLLRLLAMQAAELVLPLRETDRRAEADAAARPSELEQTVAPAAQLARVLPKSEDDEIDRDAALAREICQAVVDEVEPSRVIQAALRPIAAMLPAAPVSLYMVDATTGELIREGECDGGVCGDRPRLERSRGLTGIVLQLGQMVATQDPAADPRFDAEVDTPISGRAGPFLCLPLRLRGKVVGVFRAFLAEGDTASARTGEVLAAALSAAVRNALLYRSLLETIEEVAEARRSARR